MLRASARISFRRRPRSAVLETKSTFFPTNLDSSSSASKCPKRLTFASGMNSTSKSISLSGRISPRTAEPNSDSSLIWLIKSKISGDFDKIKSILKEAQEHEIRTYIKANSFNDWDDINALKNEITDMDRY